MTNLYLRQLLEARNNKILEKKNNIKYSVIPKTIKVVLKKLKAHNVFEFDENHVVVTIDLNPVEWDSIHRWAIDQLLHDLNENKKLAKYYLYCTEIKGDYSLGTLFLHFENKKDN